MTQPRSRYGGGTEEETIAEIAVSGPAAERRVELEGLAREIAEQTARDMALAGRPVPDRAVRVIERETLERLLAGEAGA